MDQEKDLNEELKEEIAEETAEETTAEEETPVEEPAEIFAEEETQVEEPVEVSTEEDTTVEERAEETPEEKSEEETEVKPEEETGVKPEEETGEKSAEKAEEKPEKKTEEKREASLAKKPFPLWGKILVAAGGVLLGLCLAVGGWMFGRVTAGEPVLPEKWLEALHLNKTPEETGETEAPVDEPDGKVVVATCGEHELTAAVYQIYYRMQYFNFMNQYGAYASYFGLDTSKPLDEQPSLMDGLTWDGYFRQAAMEQYSQLEAVVQTANAAGFELPADRAAELDGLAEGLNEDAIAAGYESGEAYVKEIFGSIVTMDDYLDFARAYFTATAYEDDLYENLAYTDEELDAYYDANTDALNEQGIVKADYNDVTIRHILIQPEDTESEESWAAAQAKAQEVLDLYLADPTEDNFANLAAQYSADGNAASGGIYEGVYPGQMVAEFNDWCFDQSRQPGDTGIVQTQFGWHVMYFVETLDTQTWRTNLSEAYRSEQMGKVIDDAVAAWPTTTLVETPVIQPIPIEEAEEETAPSDIIAETDLP